MSTTSSTAAFAKTSQVSIDDATTTIRSALIRLDAERAQAYGSLAVFRTTTGQVLARHARLLAVKLGDDSPRVAALNAQLAAIAGQVQELKIAQAIASTPMPQPSPPGYVLHGFIRDAKFQPVAQAALAIYDVDGKQRTDFASATSDDTGYFLLATARLLPTADAAAPAPVQMDKSAPSSLGLEVRAFTSLRSRTQIAAATFNATAGHADYRELRADTTARPSVATPSTVKKSPAPKPPFTSGLNLKAMTTELRNAPPSGDTAASAKKTDAKKPKPIKRA